MEAMNRSWLSKLMYVAREKYAYNVGRIVTLKYLLMGVAYGSNTTILASRVGTFCRFGYDNLISNSIIGDYTYTASNTKIMNSAIGKFCSISWNVSIGSYEHPINRISTHGFWYQRKYNFIKRINNSHIKSNIETKSSNIGNDVWIGCNVFIKAGVKVGNGAVIGANSAVTRDVPAYAIVAGNPAKIIRYRFSEDGITRLEAIRWWEWPDDKIRREIPLFLKDISDATDIMSVEDKVC